ncbi:MAG: DUF488 domain-containing protein [Alphaproteobacteria bacterium]|nr:DUF488 domain-containing protein [Alphaproteobacteria bacterium]
MIKIKRIYEPVEPSDGYRVLVDRLWPRGVARAGAKLDDWLKDIAPSTELRKWFHHEPERWDEFVNRYQAELQLPLQAEHLERLRKISCGRTITLLYGARNEGRNHAMVIKGLLSG